MSATTLRKNVNLSDRAAKARLGVMLGRPVSNSCRSLTWFELSQLKNIPDRNKISTVEEQNNGE